MMHKRVPNGEGDEQSYENRRGFFRFTLLEQIQLTYSNGVDTIGPQRALVLDVSGGGARISTNYRIPRVEKLIVKLSIPVLGLKEIQADIVWEEHEKDTLRYRYGLRWAHMTERQQDNLIRELYRLDMKRRGRSKN